MAKKIILLPEEKEAIITKIEEIFERAGAEEIKEVYATLCVKGIPNGAFQDYQLLSLILDLEYKIFAVRKSVEARYGEGKNNG